MLLDEAVSLEDATKVGFRSYLFYGPAGSGKTTLATRHKGNGLYLDIDERLHELVIPEEIKKRITVWTPRVTLGAQEIQVVKVDPTRKDVYNKGTKIGEEPRGYRRIVGVVNELLSKVYAGNFHYDFVVLDSMTRLMDHLEYTVMFEHNTSNMTETQYGVLKRNLKEFINGFLRLPTDRIVIAHAKHLEKRDRDTNVIIQSYTRPNVTGSMAEELPTLFSEVYYFVGRKGEAPIYNIQTAADRELIARTARPLKFVTPANPDEVFA